jgi:hypothetical protein
MIPLSQIFKLVAAERATMRAPAGTSLRKKRRRHRPPAFHTKAKRKRRPPARRTRVQPEWRAARPSPPQSSPRRTSFKSILTVAGIFLLLVAEALNRNDELSQRVGTPYEQEALEQPEPAHVGLQENSIELVSPETPVQWTEFAPSSEWAEQESSADSGRLRSTLLASSPASVATLTPRRETRQDSTDHLQAPFTGLALRGTPSDESPVNLITQAKLSQEASKSPELSSPSPQIGLRWKRLALIQTGSVGLAFMGIRKFDQYFGGAQQSFRLRNDWSRDRTLHFDELIHFQGSYRIAQGLIGLYRWSGVNATWSECLGAGTAATVMTLLEYIDGRRPKPKQGASYSDFTANLLGVGFALAKMHVGALEDVDFRLNYASFDDMLHKRTLLQYDRMTHWLTYSMKRQLHVPLHVGVGYGVKNAFKRNVHSEYYLGIGFTPLDILERVSPATAKPLSWLGIYHLGLQVQMK